MDGEWGSESARKRRLRTKGENGGWHDWAERGVNAEKLAGIAGD